MARRRRQKGAETGPGSSVANTIVWSSVSLHERRAIMGRANDRPPRRAFLIPRLEKADSTGYGEKKGE